MQAYKGVIRTVLANKAISLAAAAGVFVAAMWGFQFVKSGFFPASTSPQVVVDYYLPEGAAIERTRSDMIRMENYVRRLEGVESVQTLIGGGALRYMLVYDAGSDNASHGQLLIRTEDYKLNDGLIEQIQSYADSSFPDGQTKAWKFQMGPGGGSKIEARFSGPDPQILRTLANQAKAIMAADGRAVLIKDDWRSPVPVVEPEFSVNKGERVGITRKNLAEALEENFTGIQRGVYREGDDLIPIISRAPLSERLEPWNMTAIQILSPATGSTVPLAQVINGADLKWRDSQILRTDRVMTIRAQCDPALGELADDLFTRIKPKIEAIPFPRRLSP